jgi:hypothetical protein
MLCSLLSTCMPRYFTSFSWGRSTLPIRTVGQLLLRKVNVIYVDLLLFILILNFFAQSSILLMAAWSFIEAHPLGFVASFVAQISTSFSILVPRMWVLHHNFYCIFSCYLPLN